MINIDLNGKVVLVTGSSRGIGKAIADIFLEAGANVVCGDLLTKEEKKISENHIELPLDVNEEASVIYWINRSKEIFGHIDILVNTAGISTMDYVTESKTEDFERVLAVNTKGTYLTSKHFGKILQEQGTGGRIIQIASQAAKNGYTAMGAYVTSKHAVLGLTKTMAKELAPDNILVNAVCPGIVETDMKHRERILGGEIRGMTAEKIYEEDCSQVPLGRTGQPRDVANVVLFLASDLASYMTGQAINVTGGMTMN